MKVYHGSYKEIIRLPFAHGASSPAVCGSKGVNQCERQSNITADEIRQGGQPFCREIGDVTRRRASGMHCMSDLYLVEDLQEEYKKIKMKK